MITLQCQSYPIYFADAQSAIERVIDQKEYTSIFILVDEQTQIHCLPKIRYRKAKVIKIAAGEAHKNIDSCVQIWKALAEHGADRRSLMINLGGGVVGDMGGFAAATYMRGIDFVQVPTTLLAQVDASVGGKLGIDLSGLKNMVGLFRDPQAVIIDISMLDTLPSRQIKNGYAEIIKHALIYDADMAESLMSYRDSDLADLIQTNVAIKKSIVEQDPYEAGLRKILNFGHSFGHAIESYMLADDVDMLHGEAIAAGMICEVQLSYMKSLISEEDRDRIMRYIRRFFGAALPKELPNLMAIEELMRKDKKNESGRFMLSLLDGIGSCVYNQVCSTADIHDTLSYYNEYMALA